MATYQKYIYAKKLEELDREGMTFSDSSKIHMYSDPTLLGVRLIGVYNTVKLAYDYPLDTDLTVRLPEWSPQSVKGWVLFQELSTKPTGTTISWRVSDGTNDYYYDNSTGWTLVTLVTHWNTEAEICDNLITFPWVQKTIQFIAKLTTTDEAVAPILYGYNLLINTNINWYKDLLVDSFVPYLRTHFQLIIDYSGTTATDISTINFSTNLDFKPEQALNIVDVDGIYDIANDPNCTTSLLAAYNDETYVATLTDTVVANTLLYIRLKIEPEVIINSQHSDYLEIAKTPSIVIESIGTTGNSTKAPVTIVDIANAAGWKTDYPYMCNMTLNITIIDPLINETFALIAKANGIVSTGLGGQPNSLHTKGLDRYFGISNRAESLYNPRPNFTDVKAYNFGLTIHNFYIYTHTAESAPVVTDMVFYTNTKTEVGPNEESKQLTPMDYPAGGIWFLIEPKSVED